MEEERAVIEIGSPDDGSHIIGDEHFRMNEAWDELIDFHTFLFDNKILENIILQDGRYIKCFT